MAITKIQSESLNLADTYDFTGTVTGAGGDNTPAFYAYGTAEQYISNGTWTKVNFGTEVFDTDNNFDNSSMRFTPTTAGKYLCSFTVESTWGGSVGGNQIYTKFYKNGSSIEGIVRRMSFNDYYNNGSLDLIMTQSQSVIIDFNGSSDYLEVFHLSSATSPYLEAGSNFGAFKLIGV
jgi:hypothetical protein